MTEAEWRAATEPGPMLEFLRGKASDRKLRLFGVACCRRIWRFITDPGSQAIVELTEASADGNADVEHVLSLDYDRLTDDCGGPTEPFRTAFMVAGHVGYNFIAPVHGFPCTGDELEQARETASGAVQVVVASHDEPDDRMARFYSSDELLAKYRRRMANAHTAALQLQASEQASQSSLLRDIFGPLPFRPVTLDPTWLTSTAIALASQMYEARDFSLMPILADALRDAGCECAELLDHCCGSGPHARGCWVVDLILGKE